MLLPDTFSSSFRESIHGVCVHYMYMYTCVYVSCMYTFQRRWHGFTHVKISGTVYIFFIFLLYDVCNFMNAFTICVCLFLIEIFKHIFDRYGSDKSACKHHFSYICHHLFLYWFQGTTKLMCFFMASWWKVHPSHVKPMTWANYRSATCQSLLCQEIQSPSTVSIFQLFWTWWPDLNLICKLCE